MLSFLLLVALRAPVAFALGGAALITFVYEGFFLEVAFTRITTGISSFSLIAIPFFILSGELMLRGGIAERLVNFAARALGWMRGGLGVVNVTSSMLFGGISGSAAADVSALGSVMIPVMKEKGYDADYAVNVTVTSSIAGVVIPPSHNMLIYTLAAGGGISVTNLFLAGVVPGILMCLCLAIAAYLVAVKRGYPAESFMGFQPLLFAFVASIPGLLVAVIIVGGTLSGVFTVSESGAIGALYTLLLTGLIYRSLSLRDFWIATRDAVRTTGLVMILIGCATAFAYLLALYQVPDLIAAGITNLTDNKIAILLILNATLLVLGMLMDMAALILICTPIFLPLVLEIGMDPIQFGIILMMNLGIGLTTPPVGGCLFLGCAIGKISIEQAVRTIWPFYLALLVALLLTTYVPAFSMALPRLLNG